METFPYLLACTPLGFCCKSVVHDLFSVYVRIVAIDYDMVKVKGGKHALGHCVVVVEDEQVLFNHYIKPKTRITDYLTW